MRHSGVLILLLMFSGIASAQGPITIYLAGDSTMAHKLPEKRPETGWGEALPDFFKGDRVRFENHAQNGRSTRTFIEEKRWQTGDWIRLHEQGIINPIKQDCFTARRIDHPGTTDHVGRVASNLLEIVDLPQLRVPGTTRRLTT